MDLGIRGKRALMLASSSGLGYASAYALAKEGVDVCISSSNAGRAAAAATKIADETGVHVAGLVGDLSDPANMDSLAGAAEDAMGGPFDILFNNHGGPPLRKALEVTADELTDHTNKMLLSLIRMTQLIAPGMVDRKLGRLFMVGASAVAEPIPNNVLSNVFRGAMAYYCKALAGEVIEDGVTVNIVSPTAVLTDRTRYTAATFAEKKGITPEEELELRESRLTASRFGKPEEYGAMVAYLSGRNASYSTGANWRIDGGGVKGI